MLDPSQPDYLQRMVNVNNMLLHAYDQPCLDAGYMSMINQLRNTSWNASASEGGRQWTYQTCVEFGFFQSSSDPRQPFGDNFPAQLVKINVNILSLFNSFSICLDSSFNNVPIFSVINSLINCWNVASVSPMNFTVLINFKVHVFYSSMEQSIRGTH